MKSNRKSENANSFCHIVVILLTGIELYSTVLQACILSSFGFERKLQ